jgi:4-nitrophenyl phosphatase
MHNKQEIKLIAFDLDGTLYNGSQVIEGAIESVHFFRNRQKYVRFFTNNSGQSRKQIFEKLSQLNIELFENEVFCCSYAALCYFQQEKLYSLHIIGSESLKNDFSKAGFFVNKQNSNIDAILIGIDIDFNYQKLTNAYELIQKNKGCKLIVCNIDNNFPVENDLRKPGCGPIVASLLSAAERDFDFMLGKPNTYILDIINKDLRLKPENILIIGDSYQSDIQMAQNYGAKSILISDSVFSDTIVIDHIKILQSVFLKNFK